MKHYKEGRNHIFEFGDISLTRIKLKQWQYDEMAKYFEEEFVLAKLKRIKKAKITQLSNEDKRGNVKYHIECRNCRKEIDLRFGPKSNWSSYCPHCNELYNVAWDL